MLCRPRESVKFGLRTFDAGLSFYKHTPESLDRNYLKLFEELEDRDLTPLDIQKLRKYDTDFSKAGDLAVLGLSGTYAASKVLENDPRMSRRQFFKLAGVGAGAYLISKVGNVHSQTQNNGYVVCQCTPNTENDLKKYTFIYWKENNPGLLFEQDVPKDKIPFHIVGLEIGPVYHACLTASDLSNNESCPSMQEIVFVAMIPGNCDWSSVTSTVNRVDTYDTAMFSKSYMKARGDPLYKYWCDFNGDGVVDKRDLDILNANKLKIQRNDLGNMHVAQTIMHSAGECWL